VADRSIRIGPDGRVTIRLECPGNARAGCSGVARLSGREGEPVLSSSARYDVRRGRTRIVPLVPGAGRVSALRRLAFARVSAVEEGRPGGGRRTTLAYLPVDQIATVQPAMTPYG
jgi:hypothetical protein